MREQKHSLEELRARSRSVVDNSELVEAARTQSPSATYKLALAKTGSARKAKATRFLAMLLRDYGNEAFNETTKPAYAQHD
ncbi:MAG: hypothetical protein AAB972_01440 [Patescibacteria group bacterium]